MAVNSVDSVDQLTSESSRLAMAKLELLDLPTELVGLMCQQFCSYCYGTDEVSVLNGGESDNVNLTALRHLALTCKRLNKIATPVLYHCVKSPKKELKQHFLFLRTLIKRPDLGRFTQIAVLRGTYSKLSTIKAYIAKEATRQLGIGEPENYEDMVSFDTVVQLIIPRLPNVRVILLGGNSWESRRDNLAILDRLADRDPKAFSLPNLRQLRFMDLGCRISPKTLLGLLRLAPGLTSIRGKTGYGAFPELTFQNLVDMRLAEWRATAEELDHIMAACPALKVFWYHSDYPLDDDKLATPRDAFRSLLRLKDRLEELVLDLSFRSISEHDWRRGICAEGEDIVSFTEFSALEALSIDTSCLRFPSAEETAPDDGLLVRLLPSSIKHFKVRDVKPAHCMFIARLAQETARFPHLREVEIRKTEQYGDAYSEPDYEFEDWFDGRHEDELDHLRRSFMGAEISLREDGEISYDLGEA